MSAENMRRIAEEFIQGFEHLDRVPDLIGVLAPFMTAMARDNAEFVFFKVQSEPGWTTETGQAFADKFIHDQVLTIADVMHANGGTVEMAQDLAEVSANAYGMRLAELTAAYSAGGTA